MLSNRKDNIIKFINPLQIIIHIWQYRELIVQLTKRDITGRYKGSFIGMGWSFIQPLIMLCIYTFVFSVIFKAKWGTDTEGGKAVFALVLFMGLITFNIFSESVNSACSIILNNVNYVKKVVFPLEILPVTLFLSAFINAIFSLIILITGILLINHYIYWTLFFLPLIWLPLILFTIGCIYFLSSIGVFIRDMPAFIGMVTTILFFLSPIFYPMSAVPEGLRIFCYLNPLAVFVEESRKVVLWGVLPDWSLFVPGFLFSILVFICGFIWFMKTKKAFADVL